MRSFLSGGNVDADASRAGIKRIRIPADIGSDWNDIGFWASGIQWSYYSHSC